MARSVRPLALGCSLILVACSEAAPPAPPVAPAASASPPVSAPALPPAPTRAEIAARLHQGIDVSAHSGAVDWSKLQAAGHTFAFVKATEGDDFKDEAFDGHWTRLKETGLIRGAYHFYVTEDDPAVQADFFIQHVRLEPGDLAPVVDIETVGHDTPPGLTDRFKVWLQKVEAHYGVRPIIYTTASFWNQHLSTGFGDYPLWVAEYDVEAPKLPEGWPAWHLWQWQGDATIDGVEHGADLSRVNRDAPSLDLGALIVGQ